MEKIRWFLVLAMALVISLSANLKAEEEEETEKLVGKLAVAKDAKGKVTSATLTVNDIDLDGNDTTIVYNVTLDAKGAKMAAELAGKMVDATAVVSNKGTEEKPVYWIKVTAYSEFKEEEEKE